MKIDTRYRPQTFDEVIGQSTPVELLKAIVQQKRYGSAYMFFGPSGVGKTTLARIFSKAILCDLPVNGNPCCSCSSCKLFQEEKHFSYRELDAASFSGKDDMIQLRDEAAFTAVDKMKIIYLDECHEISRQGQDSLLKQLEQCPPHLIYIFCTTEPEKVKPTLRKRCMQFQVSRVEPPLIFDRLKKICSEEKILFEEDALLMIADRSKGHVRDSLKFLEEAAYLGPVTLSSVSKISQDHSQQVFEILVNLGRDLTKVLEAYKQISAQISAWDLYEQILVMVNDAVKVFYGYEDFIAQRKELLIRLRDIHGGCLIEFLNYLMTRDKFVDRVGVQSDLMLLHYKFSANSFKFQVATQAVTQPAQVESNPENNVSYNNIQPSQALSHAQLAKMSVADKSKALRQHRQTHNEVEKEEPPKIPSTWSLPKEKRQGLKSSDPELSPLEFSKLLVGGRGDESL